jgi:hypothetical protein
MKKSYDVIKDIELDGEHLKPGKQIDLTDEQAAYPLQEGHIVATPEVPAAAPKRSKAAE